MTYYTKHLFVCANQKAAGKTCCADKGGDAFFDYLKTQLREQGLHGSGKFRASKTGCLGRCDSGPCLVIYPESIWYTYASFADIDEIIAQHLIAGEPVKRLLIKAA